MKKHIIDLVITRAEHLAGRFALLVARPQSGSLPPMQPGQFAQLLVEDSPATYLRRPISIHDVCPEHHQVSFLIQMVGPGSRHLGALQPGARLNAILPLGHGFSLPANPQQRILLVGGGVGIAPLLFMGRRMAQMGCTPTFLLGARTAADLIRLPHYQALGPVFVTTEDGSMGQQGFVTQHTLLHDATFTRVSVCGPGPMMRAVARWARQEGIDCEVSLENMMACGLGACLCCVEDTQAGHVCVCKEGPVFNINDLKWQI